jgi:hypothetical protein
MMISMSQTRNFVLEIYKSDNKVDYRVAFGNDPRTMIDRFCHEVQKGVPISIRDNRRDQMLNYGFKHLAIFVNFQPGDVKEPSISEKILEYEKLGGKGKLSLYDKDLLSEITAEISNDSKESIKALF